VKVAISDTTLASCSSNKRAFSPFLYRSITLYESERVSMRARGWFGGFGLVWYWITYAIDELEQEALQLLLVEREVQYRR